MNFHFDLPFTLRIVGAVISIAGAVGLTVLALRREFHRTRLINVGFGVTVIGIVVLGIGFYIGQGHQWGRAALSGKELTYLWRYRDNAGKEIRGEFIAKATGKTREIEGRKFVEMGFDWRGVPLTAGVYYFRVSEDGIETVTLAEDGKGRPEKILEFPAEEGREWKFAGAVKARILRTGAEFTDASGTKWSDCVCVGIYNGPKAMGEMWLNPEIGSLASKVFFNNLGYNEQILKCVK